MKTIYESAAETAKKVRKELKVTFPGVKFSVTSNTYSMGCSVSVHWTDGPMNNQVDDVLNRFKSSSFDGMQDMKVTTGYMFEGKLYNGADYVTGSRTRSSELIAVLEQKASEMFETVNRNSWEYGRQLADAEKELTGYKEEWEIQEEIQPAPVVVETPVNNVISLVARQEEIQKDKINKETVDTFMTDILPHLTDSEMLAISTATDKGAARTAILRAMVRIKLVGLV